MRAETQAVVTDIESSLALLRRHLDWDVALKRLEELISLSESPDLWNSPEKAQKIMREKNRLAAQIDSVRAIEQGVSDNAGLIEMAEEEGDESLINEAHTALEKIREDARQRQIESLLSGEADGNDAYLQVNAGAGGTEAQDWAQILLRMYTRWAGQRGFGVSLLDESQGEEAGLKSATIKIEGDQAYGWLKTENGVHRLVRISPFDSNARRHTSFASISISPVIDDEVKIEIEEKDLRIDTYRAQGAGGQHVNKTESAVRITHIPTNTVAASQSGRSQHQNRAEAYEMLRAKLYALEIQKREDEKAKLQGEKTDIGWGHQIRSYVLQPYQMIKDLRTGVENTDAQAVLDGDIDEFLEASLAQRLGNK
ncbi:MAG TPA: peptide chain release factor 2 [Alphaproteobacteria bacterium]|nr:peptide chain release factor 2 [Micavibrio sp.]MBK9563432.1 peptide chain release factor 2 [Micavibrio sp.]HQX27566.1 peptide chain release factor 2 [Alphaproteobacteria bacterium]